MNKRWKIKMEKYVVIVREGLYLGDIKTDGVTLKMSITYHDVQNKALRVPLEIYLGSKLVKNQVDEIAVIAEGKVAIIEISETVTTLNGEKIDLKYEQQREEEEDIRDDFARWLIKSFARR